MAVNGSVKVGSKLSDGQATICQLLADGYRIEARPVIEGRVACGKIGVGGMCFPGSMLGKLVAWQLINDDLQLTERGTRRFRPTKNTPRVPMRY